MTMREILIVVAIRMTALFLVIGLISFGSSILRPILYPNGLPAVVVLGLIVGFILGGTWWLILTLWPLVVECERRLERTVRQTHERE